MPQMADSTELYIGAGRLYFDRFDINGNSTSYRFVGNASKCEQSVSTEKKDRWDYTKKARTKLAQITVTQTHTLSIDLDEMQSDNIALAVLGSAAFYTQTGGPQTGVVLASTTATSGIVPLPALNQILDTGFRLISAVTVTAFVNSTATVLNAGTDYEMENASEGLIRILPTANLPNGVTDIKADFTAAAVTSTAKKKIVTAGDTATIIGRAKFIEDPVAGKARTVTWPRIHIEPSSALALIGEDFGSLSFSAEVLTPLDGRPLYNIVTQ